MHLSQQNFSKFKCHRKNLKRTLHLNCLLKILLTQIIFTTEMLSISIFKFYMNFTQYSEKQLQENMQKSYNSS